MFERFTAPARRVVVLAQEEARMLGQDWIGGEHLLIGLIDDDGVAGQVLTGAGLSTAAARTVLRARSGDAALDGDALRTFGIDLDEVRRSVEDQFGPGALDDDRPGRWGRRRGGAAGHIPFTRGAKKGLELALREAVALDSRSIGGEHLLLGILREDGEAVRRVLTAAGTDGDALRTTVLTRLRRSA